MQDRIVDVHGDICVISGAQKRDPGTNSCSTQSYSGSPNDGKLKNSVGTFQRFISIRKNLIDFLTTLQKYYMVTVDFFCNDTMNFTEDFYTCIVYRY